MRAERTARARILLRRCGATTRPRVHCDLCDSQRGFTHTPLSCDDGIACTVDSCDSAHRLRAPQRRCAMRRRHRVHDGLMCSGPACICRMRLRAARRVLPMALKSAPDARVRGGQCAGVRRRRGVPSTAATSHRSSAAHARRFAMSSGINLRTRGCGASPTSVSADTLYDVEMPRGAVTVIGADGGRRRRPDGDAQTTSRSIRTARCTGWRAATW